MSSRRRRNPERPVRPVTGLAGPRGNDIVPERLATFAERFTRAASRTPGVITNFADRLTEKIRRLHAPVCVGLDPLPGRLPPSIRQQYGLGGGTRAPNPSAGDAAAEALLTFGRGIIEAIAPVVPALKINIAFFEAFRDAGVRVYYQLVREAHAAGLIVIGDIKRADIGHSTGQYAAAHLHGGGADDSCIPDAVTVNPYFGFDAIKPFADAARTTGRGLFVLVQTSNESAALVQGLTLADGRSLADAVAGMVETWAVGDGLVGSSGYSCIGAVVSPRDVPATRRLRALMPHSIFLVPGFGAQGRTADEVVTCFREDGAGAIVNASRSVIYAYEGASAGTDAAWTAQVSAACRAFVDTVREVLPGA